MPLNGTDSKGGVCQVGADRRESPGRPITLLGNRAMPCMNGLCLIGLASSFLIGFIQSGQIRAPLDRRFLATLGALILFGYFVWPIVLGSPHRSDAFIRLFAYYALVPMQV